MCHYISGRNHYFGTIEVKKTEFFVGSKEMQATLSKKRSPTRTVILLDSLYVSTRTPFRYKLTERNRFGLVVKTTQPVKQPIRMTIPIKQRPEAKVIQEVRISPKRGGVISGYHISPLYLSCFEIRKEGEVTIPVLFSKESILFYDGDDIGVTSFIIPTPQTYQYIKTVYHDIITDPWNITSEHNYYITYREFYKLLRNNLKK